MTESGFLTTCYVAVLLLGVSIVMLLAARIASKINPYTEYVAMCGGVSGGCFITFLCVTVPIVNYLVGGR